MSTRTISSEKARTEWRALLDDASKGEADVVIERHGKPTAVVISYATYEALRPALAELRTGSPASHRGQRMADALAQLAQAPERMAVPDPIAWQREQRRERTQPGRDCSC